MAHRAIQGPAPGRAAESARRVRQVLAQAGGLPDVKKKGRSKDSATYFSNCFTYRDGRIKLAKQAQPLDIRWSRPLPEGAVPSQVTVSRDARGRYHISILVEGTITEHDPTEVMVGLDAGITSLYTLSTGEKIHNPQHEKNDRAKLAKRNAHWRTNRRDRTTGPRRAKRSPRSTPASLTGAGTICTSSPLDWCAKTK